MLQQHRLRGKSVSWFPFWSSLKKLSWQRLLQIVFRGTVLFAILSALVYQTILWDRLYPEHNKDRIFRKPTKPTIWQTWKKRQLPEHTLSSTGTLSCPRIPNTIVVSWTTPISTTLCAFILREPMSRRPLRPSSPIWGPSGLTCGGTVSSTSMVGCTWTPIRSLPPIYATGR